MDAKRQNRMGGWGAGQVSGVPFGRRRRLCRNHLPKAIFRVSADNSINAIRHY